MNVLLCITSSSIHVRQLHEFKTSFLRPLTVFKQVSQAFPPNAAEILSLRIKLRYKNLKCCKRDLLRGTLASHIFHVMQLQCVRKARADESRVARFPSVISQPGEVPSPSKTSERGLVSASRVRRRCNLHTRAAFDCRSANAPRVKDHTDEPGWTLTLRTRDYIGLTHAPPLRTCTPKAEAEGTH